jgi:hypothetical protein
MMPACIMHNYEFKTNLEFKAAVGRRQIPHGG